MKARNENGNIVVYSEQQMQQKFNRFKLANGKDVDLFYASAKEVLEENRFFDYVQPPLSEGQRYGEKYKDEVNKVFTCYVEQIPPKTQAELEQEKEQKYQNEKERIKQVKWNKMVEDAINAAPLENPTYYKEWAAGTYVINAIVMYKSKLFKNTTAGNINAPDKGGWTEIK